MIAQVPQAQEPVPEFFTSPRVRNWLSGRVFKQCGDWHTAEDITSEVIFLIFEKWSTGEFDMDKPGKLSFALKSARYRLFRYWRSKRRSVSLGFDPVSHRENRAAEIQEQESQTIARLEDTVDLMREVCTETQFRRVIAYLKGEEQISIARREGVGRQVVHNSIEEGVFKFRKRSHLALNARNRIA